MSIDCVVDDRCRAFIKDFDTFVEIWNDCSYFHDATLAGIEFNDEHDSCIVRPLSPGLNTDELTIPNTSTLHQCFVKEAPKVRRAPFARVRPILCEYNFGRITNDYWQISHLPFHLLTLEDFAAEA